MSRITTLLVSVHLWVVSFVGTVTADIDARQVITALERGTVFLQRAQSARGRWPDLVGSPDGVTALCTLALLNAGAAADDPHVQQALVALRKIETTKTYPVALQTMVFCAAEPKADLVRIQRNVRWLEQTQIKSGRDRGAWSYPGTHGDNSNSQFAVLALYEAHRAGIEVQEATWQRAAEYWQRTQNPDGSWGYKPGFPGTGSMTCAGIAALVITTGRTTAGDASVRDGKVCCCERRQPENDALERALAWLGRNFSVRKNPGNRGFGATWLYYYLYGVERVGRMTARRFLGAHDWYREGAEQLIREQDALNGSWSGSGHAENDPNIATSLALLFLAKGRRPVLVAKVKHGPGEDWNNHRSDLAHLTAFTEECWKRDLTWQVLDPESATVEDLLQAPVLFISGRLAPELSAAAKRKLRAYIDRGGFVFAEACCLGQPFDRALRQLIDEIFPEPEYRLRPLPPEHPIWRAEQRVDPKYLRPLWGIDYGCRTCVVYCPEDLSCYWELSRSERGTTWPTDVQQSIDAANAIGVNVLTYATGREPKFKEAAFQSTPAAEPLGGAQRGVIAVAKLQHPGGCDAAPGALANLLRAAGSQLKLRIDARDHTLAMTDQELFRYHMVFMHGRHAFQLTSAERQQLATYVQRGGTLLADAICASKPFADSFRQEMKSIFPDRPLERIPVNHPLFTDVFGGYDITSVSRRVPQQGTADKSLRVQVRPVEPQLEGIQTNERYSVVFSPYDLSCALEEYASLECNGYTREDAAKIGLNVLLYSLHP